MSDEHTLGAYRLIAELGHGGMADVFLAAIEGPAGSGFTKLAVVKKLRSHLAEDPEFVSMLMDEARLTARLTHPNVIQLFELGHVDGHYFLAMEFLEGQPFHRVAQRVSRLAPDLPRHVSYSVVSDVLAGLHYAHELKDYDGTPLGVVHRDVTPHNVFVTYDGAVKVVDFGIAKAVGRATETQCGVVKGKVRYMSPEQAAGKDADRRTDVFAAGVMLWNAATGAKLWGSRDDVGVSRALYSGDYPASPRAEFPEVPVEIDAICRRALAFRREDRYETADDMRADIERFLGGRSAEARKLRANAMKDLFESDRAKVRAVLEASALNKVAHAGVLKATISTAPRATAAEPVSVAPLALSTSAEPPVSSGVPAGAPAKRARPAKTRRVGRATRGLAIAASIAAAAVVAVSAAALGVRSSHQDVAQAAVVASELTTSSNQLRAKVARSAAPLTEHAPSHKHSSRPRRASTRGQPGHGASAPADNAAANGAGAPASEKLLDNGDPWASGSRR